MVKKTGFVVKTKLTKGKKSFSKADLDNDGVPNHKDCNPYDPKKQDFGGINAPVERTRTFRGYNVDDYYYSNGQYIKMPGAKSHEKKGFFSRLKGD